MPETELSPQVIRLFDDQVDESLVEAGGGGNSSPVRIPYTGSYRIRGLWTTDRYTKLRNAAWAVRNARVASHLNPLALKLVLAEAERLLGEGEDLWDVLEAFAELLTRP